MMEEVYRHTGTVQDLSASRKMSRGDPVHGQPDRIRDSFRLENPAGFFLCLSHPPFVWAQLVAKYEVQIVVA